MTRRTTRRGDLTPDLGHADSSTTLGKRESKDGKEELHRRVPTQGGGSVRVHAGRDAQGHRGRSRDIPGRVEGVGQQARFRNDDGRHADARGVDGATGVAGGEDHPPGGGVNGHAGRGPQARDGTGHPPSGGEVFRRGDELVNRFQFVEDHKDAYGVKRLCEIVEIARSSFYAWLAAAPGRAERQAADAALAARIRVLQDPDQGGDRAYGAPRITADLNDGVLPQERVNHKRVARVMREHQLA
ncbi:MAG TPA: hypothetical protein DCR63_01460, partial [Microbacterium sp.]|nr:hypothetical protein [Microbacterium sp.]